MRTLFPWIPRDARTSLSLAAGIRAGRRIGTANQGGTLIFIPTDARSLLLPVDVEYATWANPRSECVYF